MGRAASGVNGIKLAKGDKVASLEVVQPDCDLLVVTTNGYGKRTLLSEYPAKGRATGGVATINKDALKKVGVITAARVVHEEDDLTMISAGGSVLRTRVQAIPRSRRVGQVVVVMSLEKGDTVASLARIAAADLRKAGAE
jgi:DNA gyrase subunit A